MVRDSVGGFGTLSGTGGLALTSEAGRIAFAVAGVEVMVGRAARVGGSLGEVAAVKEGGDGRETIFLHSVLIVVPNAIGVAFGIEGGVKVDRTRVRLVAALGPNPLRKREEFVGSRYLGDASTAAGLGLLPRP